MIYTLHNFTNLIIGGYILKSVRRVTTDVSSRDEGYIAYPIISLFPQTYERMNLADALVTTHFPAGEPIIKQVIEPNIQQIYFHIF